MNRVEKTYYQKLDIIRVISCIAVFLYHLNILKGGFLAVCTFFTLSGYLSCISSLKKEKFSIKKYYLSRIKKIYLPLFIITMLTISTLKLFPNINLLTLKPETNSILLGYNNFWQLNANLDYFAHHIDSPFMHMWYISILLQFELIFPIAFIILKGIGNKIQKYLPSILILIFSIISYYYFYQNITNNNIMIAYYHTLARIYSCLLGVSLAFITFNNNKEIPKKIIFYIYLLLLIALFILNFKHLEITMLLSSLITLRLIKYGTIKQKENNNIITKIIKSISNISYEIYLIQYPVIFIFQKIKIDNTIKIPCIIIITILLSYIINLSLNIKKQNKIKIIRLILCILISLITIYGTYQYIKTEDHTKEMKELEEKLAKNKLLTKQKQEEYQKRIKEEQEAWQLELNQFSLKEEELKQKITNLPVVGIGDSVMLGASNALYKVFPNGYFDGKVNRTELDAREILIDLENKGLLTDILIFNLGTNGECASTCKKKIMSAVGNRQVFWVNATYPDYDTCNPNLNKAAEEYPNIHIVDWVSVVEKHPEYVASDKTHVGGYGAKIYSETIYNTIYQYYLQELNKTKEDLIKTHEQEEKNKTTLIGNDLLLNTYEYLQEEINNQEFIIDSNFTYNSLKNELNRRIESNTLTNNIIFIFDNTLSLTKEEYQDIIDICKNKKITIITTKKLTNLDQENIEIININNEIKKHNDYLSPDKIHLTKEGNIYLSKIIKKILKKEDNYEQ